jgi:hypothetical protein
MLIIAKTARTRRSESFVKVSFLTDEMQNDFFSSFQFFLFHAAPIEESIFGITSHWIVVISISSFLLLLALGVSLGICICRRKATSSSKSQLTQPDLNGSKHLNSYRPAVLGKLNGNVGLKVKIKFLV